jgi:WD repeat-containing protein 1 (actin-interacting protein 1)
LNWETFAGDTEFGGHVKNVISADIKTTKPFKIVSGGEDFFLAFHQGPPFKLVSTKKEHNNFINCVKFSPDSTKFASTGFDKKINIWESNENTLLFTLDSSIPNAHNMSIMSLIWLDENTLATTSSDKSVKIWDLETKSVKFTLYPVEKSQLGEANMGCGIAFSHSLKYLIMLSFEGKLNIWNYDLLENEKLPDFEIKGHQNSLTHIKYSPKFEKLYSLDNVGKIGNYFIIFSYR